MDAKYPECDKWAKVHNDARVILEYLEWRDYQGDNLPYRSDEERVYEYFNIDPKKLETERSTMLKELQNGQ